MARFKLEVCSASCNHSARYGTVIADQRTHLDEQTLASGGGKDIWIKWNLSDAKDGKGQKSEHWLTATVIAKAM